METTRRNTLVMLGGAAAATALPGSLSAENHEPKEIVVEMLNKNPENSREAMYFNPPVIRANVGDTVKFMPTDRGHNCQVNEDMMPAGGDEWKGRINEEISVTFTTEGTYGFNCQPHVGQGMVGLVLVGDASVNFEDAKGVRQRGRAKNRYEEYFTMAEEMLAAEA